MTAREPGVYEDVPDTDYHHDQVSLSSSGARTLLNDSPARFAYDREHGSGPKRTYDLGHAAHRLVLGAGSELVEVEHDNYLTKAAKEAKADAYAQGLVPLLSKEMRVAEAMAAKVRSHPVAAMLLEAGRPEVSLYWTDEASGVQLRARPDWLPARPGRLIITDYKTTVTAHPKKFARKAADYGYHQQAPWYIDGAIALELDEDPAFVFIAQEKEPPYLVSVVELDAAAIAEGRRLNRQAIDLYAQCVEDNEWPGYGDGVELLSLPAWAAPRIEEEGPIYV